MDPSKQEYGKEKVKVKVTQPCPTLWSHRLYSPWNSPGQNTGVGSHFFLQWIFPTQGLNPALLHCRILEWAAIPYCRWSSWPWFGSPALPLYCMKPLEIRNQGHLFSAIDVLFWSPRSYENKGPERQTLLWQPRFKFKGENNWEATAEKKKKILLSYSLHLVEGNRKWKINKLTYVIVSEAVRWYGSTIGYTVCKVILQTPFIHLANIYWVSNMFQSLCL